MPEKGMRGTPRGPAGAVLATVLAAAVVLPATAAQAQLPQNVAWGTAVGASSGLRAELFGVAAAGADDVWAVGASNPARPASTNPYRAFAEHWDGQTWTATPVAVPSLYGASQAERLTDVEVVGSGSSAWAVGYVANNASLASRTLAYRWDGGGWTPTVTPNPGGNSLPNRLHGVAVRHGSDVWAVGETGYPQQSLVLRWNGTAWASAAGPQIGSLAAVTLDDDNVWVAGSRTVARFDGAGWTQLPALPVPQGSSLVLRGLATSDQGLWAVGNTLHPYFDGYIYRSYAAVYRQNAWTTVGVGGTVLHAVTAAGSTVLAAGDTSVFRLTPSGASREVTPQGTVSLHGVDLDSTGNAWAVGTEHTGTGRQPARWNAPGTGQGGIAVTSNAGTATLTWIGPANGAGTTASGGGFAVGGLPAGTYTVVVSYGGCAPGVASATVTAGRTTSVEVSVTC